jgi:uncharacterized integral membrane protein (TIGR00698 family)
MNRLMGIAFTAALAAGATGLAQAGWLQANGMSVLTLAIVLGMVAGNTVYPRVESGSAAGVAFSKNTLLRAGIVLYGLRLTLQDVATVGATGIAIDAVVLTSTFALACWAGTRVFGLDRTTAMLIGAGSSICGAAAVMATEPVVRGRSDQVTVAVSTVVVFGTLAIFLYPVLYHANQRFGPFAVSPTAYGIFAGSTIHEVAQVVAAGRAIGEAAADTAVITKMVRVMMLAPFLVILSMVQSRTGATGATGAARRITVPWFALGFVALTAFNSLKLLPRPFIEAAVQVDTLVLAMAMAALGLGTRWSAIRAAGARPLALAALLFGWLLCGGSAINAAIQRAFAG